MTRTGKRMPIAKAHAIARELKENGYNQKKALLSVGYSKGTAEGRSGEVVNTAFRTIARDNLERLEGKQLGKRTILEMTGMTEENVLAEYLYIAQQDKDLTNKLKALVPLLKHLGITWEDKATLVAPTLNLTVKQNTPEARLNQATPQDDPQHVLCDVDKPSYTIDNMAILSHETEVEGGSVSSNQEEKEGESPIRKNVENSDIDIEPIVLPNIETNE